MREKLLTDCNVHTIIRLPQSVFAPYATVNTNLIFFEKGKRMSEAEFTEYSKLKNEKNSGYSVNSDNSDSDNYNYATKEIWYYEHTLPEGAKAYNKTKPIRIEEFDGIKEWWNNRAESEVCWKVPIATIKERGFDLDIKNPNKVVEEVVYDRKAIIKRIETNQGKISEILNELIELS